MNCFTGHGIFMATDVSADRIATVRAFNRSYTKFLDALNEHHLHTPFSLTEARVLYELGQRDETEVAALRQACGLDAGYLSRLLSRFEEHGLVRRDRSGADARRQIIRLTGKGHDAFRVLDTRTVDHIRTLLADLSDDEQVRLVDAMDMIRRRIDRPAGRPRPVTSVGSSSGTARATPRSTGSTRPTRHSWRGSSPATSTSTTPGPSGPGSRSCGVSGSAPSSACARTTPPPNCGCCTSSRARAARGSAPPSSTSASGSPGRPATTRWNSGPSRYWRRRGGSTSGPASSWSRRTARCASACL